MTDTAISYDAGAERLLAIPPDHPHRLFLRDAGMSAALWRRLVKRWHPDHAGRPGAAAVFVHIARLHQTAGDWRAQGRWEEEDAVLLRGADGVTRRLRYRARHASELGETLIGRRTVATLIARTHADLDANAARRINALRFADAAMAGEMRSWLPQIVGQVQAPGLIATVLSSRPDFVLLADLLAHQGGALDPRAVGWIVGGMLHVACYLDWAGLAHNAIGPDTWLVSPQCHDGALLGGWAYAGAVGARSVAAPARTVAAAPSRWRSEKTACAAMDRELIKLTARELLGLATGIRARQAVPAPLIAWLDHPVRARAVDDYAAWRDALQASFGPPRFTAMAATPDQIYPREGG